MARRKWIQAMHMKKGALTKQAKAAGESPMEFAREHKGAKGTTGRRARLALTLRGLAKHGK